MQHLEMWSSFLGALERSGVPLDAFICSGRDKRPLGGPGWQNRPIAATTAYQRLRAGENVAILTGPGNPSLFIVDTDGPQADDWFRGQLDALGITGTAFRYGGKGKHYYFLAGPETPKARISIAEGIDLLGAASNGNAICPGSTRHPGPKDPEGTEALVYGWQINTIDGKIPPLPEALLKQLLDASNKKKAPSKEANPAEACFPQARSLGAFIRQLEANSPASRMTDGRDNYLMRLGGTVRQRYAATYEQVLKVMLAENSNFAMSHPEGPLAVEEVERKAKTISEYQAKEAEKYTFIQAAQDTLDRLEDSNRLLFDLVTENFYQHQEGVYVEKTKKEINFAIQDTLDEAGMANLGKASFLNDAIVRLQKITAGKPKLNTWMDKSKQGHFIVLEDCILDVKAYSEVIGILDPEEMQDESFIESIGLDKWRMKHTPEFFTLTKLPFRLDEAATCKQWESHIANLMPDLHTRIEFQKFVGLCLIYDTSYQRAAILLGEGGAGKGTVLRTIEQLVGLANRSAVSLQDISDKFTAIEMYGKLLNVDADTKADTFDEAIFKKITGEDPIPWQQKYSRAFSAESTARWIISANKLPSITDKSRGVWRRLLLFKVEPPSYQAPDIGLQAKLSSELPGIFNWAIQGLAMLWSQGFNPSAKMIQELEDARTSNNNVALWVDERCKINATSSVNRAEAYGNYSEFCLKSGFKPLNVTNWKQAVESLGYKVSRTNQAGTREERVIGLSIGYLQ